MFLVETDVINDMISRNRKGTYQSVLYRMTGKNNDRSIHNAYAFNKEKGVCAKKESCIPNFVGEIAAASAAAASLSFFLSPPLPLRFPQLCVTHHPSQ